MHSVRISVFVVTGWLCTYVEDGPGADKICAGASTGLGAQG